MRFFSDGYRVFLYLISRGPLSLYEVDAYTMIMNGGLQQIKDYLQNFGKDLGYCRYFAFLCIR
jgi:hypothetical protein